MSKPVFDPLKSLALANKTFDIEAQAILGLKTSLDEGFSRAVSLILRAEGRVVVVGMGKSGHIGRKIAATLSSTGTPSMFVHPAEAGHGDLGMIVRTDLVLAISNSGETEELKLILPLIKRLGVYLIALTSKPDSSLAKHADVFLNCAVEKEACPLNLAPTASTTAQLAMGDALAMALLDARGFGVKDFAQSHPGGALGRRLLTYVRDIMRVGDALPMVGQDAPLSAVMQEMSRKGLGATAVVGDGQLILGIFTDGDLRRQVEKGIDLRDMLAHQVMTPNPFTISPDALAVEAAEIMEKQKVTSVLVADKAGHLCGAINTNDLMRTKVI